MLQAQNTVMDMDTVTVTDIRDTTIIIQIVSQKVDSGNASLRLEENNVIVLMPIGTSHVL